MPPSRLRNPTRPIQTGYVPSSQCQTTALRRKPKGSQKTKRQRQPSHEDHQTFSIPGTLCWASNAGGDVHRLGLTRRRARRPFGLSTPAASQSQLAQSANARRELFRVPRQTTIPKEWWSRTGSNRRPEACKATALPTELRPLSVCLKRRRRYPSPWLDAPKGAAAIRPFDAYGVGTTLNSSGTANHAAAKLPKARPRAAHVCASQNHKVVGLGRLERPTSPLSGVRSNHLSYRPSHPAKPDPIILQNDDHGPDGHPGRKRNEDGDLSPNGT